MVSAVAVFAFTAIAPASAQTLNDPEFNSALAWGFENELTRYNTVEAFQPFNSLLREQGAKFTSVFGATNLCLEADASATGCNFNDLNTADSTLDEYIVLACQQGLVKGSNNMFMPKNTMTKVELITVLVRALRASEGKDPLLDETLSPWYTQYVLDAQARGLVRVVDTASLNANVNRYEAFLMMYRARNDMAECSEDLDITDILDGIFGDDDDTDVDDMDDMDDMDDDDNDDDDTTDEVTTSNGMVMASLSSSTPAGATVPGLASVEVATFDFTASNDDVMLESVTLERFGLGSDDVVEDVTLLVDGQVVTRSRSFNSDDEARLTLNPAVMIEAGETVEVTVLAELGDAE